VPYVGVKRLGVKRIERRFGGKVDPCGVEVAEHAPAPTRDLGERVGFVGPRTRLRRKDDRLEEHERGEQLRLAQRRHHEAGTAHRVARRHDRAPAVTHVHVSCYGERVVAEGLPVQRSVARSCGVAVSAVVERGARVRGKSCRNRSEHATVETRRM